MKRAIYTSILLALLVTISRAQAPVDDRSSTCFLENKGQWNPNAKYLLHSGGMNLWVTDSGMVYDLYKSVAVTFRSRSVWAAEANSHRDLKVTATRTGQVVRLSFLNTALSHIAASNPENGITNYFIGNDSSRWATGVRSFCNVTIQNLYDGIDAVFYLDNGQPRYDLVLQPGADESKIEMKIEGADGIESTDGNSLTIKTSMGNIQEVGLFAYQNVSGAKQQVDCKFQIVDSNHVSFRLGAFDRTKPLTIDPLIYSTYLGGGGDAATAIAVDRFGSSYVTGWTASQDFPVTAGAYQKSDNNTSSGANVFISKMNANGSALIYSTYLGGSGGSSPSGWIDEAGESIAIDSSGNAYIAGITDSKDFPTTPGAYQRFSKLTNSGFYSNAFVAKLNPTGSALLYSTYLSGSNGYWDGEGESASGIAVDSIGEAYVVGTTSSSDFPVTTGAYQPKNLNFSYNIESDGRSAFVTKLNARGSGLMFSTYLGGLTNPLVLPGAAESNGTAIALDRTGNAYVIGNTLATDFPVTPGAYNISPNPADYNSFVTKLNAKGAALIYSTYLGSTNDGEISSIAVDTSGNAYITGSTSSTNYPVTPGAYQTMNRGTKGNAFVTKLNASGSGLIYSTYLGGTIQDEATGIAIDSSGDAYIAGGTWSRDFPTLPGAIQTKNASLAKYYPTNAFVTELNESGSALLYSTYLGGSVGGQANGIAIDSSRSVYVVGETTSNDFPVTSGVFQESAPDTGGESCFVTKLSPLTMYLTADTSLRDFGAGSLCRTADTSIIFTNSGTDTLLVKQIEVMGNAFSLVRQPSSALLLPGESDTVAVKYNPSAAGSDTASLSVVTNATDSLLFCTFIARTVNPPVLHIVPALSRTSASSADTTTLWIYPDTTVSNNLGLNSLKFTLTWNSDLLTQLNIASAVPGATLNTVSKTKDGMTNLAITLSGANLILTPGQPIAAIVYDASIADSASTQITVGDPILNGNIDSSYTRCTLDAAGGSTTFSLKLSCSDSLIMAALNNRLLFDFISIYPNPTTGLLHIESTSDDIVITDLLGRIRMRAVAVDGTIDVSGLPQGVYSIGDGVSRAQFVKE